MKTLSIDIETYSSVELPKCGVYKYTEAPDFDILLFGYSVDGGPVQVVDLASGETIPDEVVAALTDDSVTKSPICDDDPDLTLEDVLESDTPSPESILMDRELLDALYEELDRLDPDGRRICELIMAGKTERQMAAELGRSQSTLNYQKRKVLSLLREALKDFV